MTRPAAAALLVLAALAVTAGARPGDGAVAAPAAATAAAAPARTASALRTGSLSVAPGSLTVGPVLAGVLAQGQIVLTNNGTTDLTLGDLFVDDPAFDIGSRSGGIPAGTTIAPAAQLSVPVSFRSTTQGTTAAVLTIPSDDPVQPEVTVPLFGLVSSAPAMSVSPDSLNEVLGSGVSMMRDLAITNTGAADAADLVWTLSVVPVAGKARAAADLQGVSILWDRTHGQTSTVVWSSIVDSLTALGATVDVVAAPAVLDSTLLSGYRLFWTVDAAGTWTAAEQAVLSAWTTNGGSVLILGDNSSSLVPFDALLSGVGSGIRFSALTAANAATDAIFPHPVTQGITSVYVGIGARSLTVPSPAERIIEDVAARAVGAVETIGLGRVAAFSDELFDDGAILAGPQNFQLGLQAVEWLVGTTWLTSATGSGAVAPGSTQTVTLTLDTTGLPAGIFNLAVRLSSNDPVAPVVSVPVRLEIIGVPDITVTPSALDFGSVGQGISALDSVFVHNAGDDTLNVSGASVGGTRFSVASAAFLLAPAESAAIAVQFAPDSLGAFTDTLTITSDDPDEPSVTVPLSGTGRVDCAGPCVAPYLRALDANGSPNFLFPVDIEVSGNPAAISAFGFTLEYDATQIQFADSASNGTLMAGANVQAQENQPGLVTCGGFGGTPVPAGATGTIARLWFNVSCPACSIGTMSDLILDDLTDDVAALGTCCGTFTLSACPLGTGDVNSDGTLTPQDALCALKIFLNGGTAPPDSQCDGNGDCEVEVADANCDMQVTPGDALIIQNAWLAGTPPTTCLGGGGRGTAGGDAAPALAERAHGSAALRWGTSRREDDGRWVLPLEAPGEVPRAFGLELDPGGWILESLSSGKAGGWEHLEAGRPGERVRIAGLDPAARGRSGVVAELRFRDGAADGPAGGPAGAGGPAAAPLRVTAAFDVRFTGPADAFPGAGPPAAAARGLIAVGPLPAASSTRITFGVGTEPAPVDLWVVDVRGRRIRTLVSGVRPAGDHAAVWDGTDDAGRPAAAGIYFARLRVGEETWTRKVVRLR